MERDERRRRDEERRRRDRDRSRSRERDVKRESMASRMAREERERKDEENRRKWSGTIDTIEGKKYTQYIVEDKNELREKWDREDRERERLRKIEMDKLDMEEATKMKELSLRERSILERNYFDSYGAYFTYLIIMIEMAINDNDEVLIDKLKFKVKNNMAHMYMQSAKDYSKFLYEYLATHDTDFDVLKFFGGILSIPYILTTAETYRLENRLPSIMNQAIKEGVIEPVDWAKFIIRNYNGNLFEYDIGEIARMLETLLYDYNSREMRNEIEQVYRNTSFRSRERGEGGGYHRRYQTEEQRNEIIERTVRNYIEARENV